MGAFKRRLRRATTRQTGNIGRSGARRAAGVLLVPPLRPQCRAGYGAADRTPRPDVPVPELGGRMRCTSCDARDVATAAWPRHGGGRCALRLAAGRVGDSVSGRGKIMDSPTHAIEHGTERER